MAKHPVFGMVDCWGCGNPTVTGGPFTAGCPGCFPGMLPCEKASDYDTQELLHPELRECRMIDEALIEQALLEEKIKGESGTKIIEKLFPRA